MARTNPTHQHWSPLDAANHGSPRETNVSKGNREKKKPKQVKAKDMPAATPFGAASNAGKAAGKRR